MLSPYVKNIGDFPRIGHEGQRIVRGQKLMQAKPATFELYADLCARTLARAHARSGDTVAIAAYLGDHKAFTDAVEVFAVAEAHFVAGDHKRLTEAIAAGELEAADIEGA